MSGAGRRQPLPTALAIAAVIGFILFIFGDLTGTAGFARGESRGHRDGNRDYRREVEAPLRDR